MADKYDAMIDAVGAPDKYDQMIDAVSSNSGPSVKDYLLSKDVPGGGSADILGGAARLGGALNSGANDIAGSISELRGRLGFPAAASAVEPTILATAADFLIPQNRLGVATLLAGPLLRGANAGYKALTGAADSNAPGFLANLSQGMARLNPNKVQQYINNADEFMAAKPLAEAEKGYAEAIGGLMGKTQSIGQRLGKVVVNTGDYDAAINRAGELLRNTQAAASEAGQLPGQLGFSQVKGEKLNPQSALEGIQSINQALRDREFTKALSGDRARNIYELKDNLMEWMQNNGHPELRNAAKELFKSHVKDEMSNWFPQNKYGSTDALRTWATGSGLLKSLGTAGGAALAGFPFSAAAMAGGATAGAAAVSPRAWMVGLNTLNSLGKPAAQTGLALIANNLSGDKSEQQTAGGEMNDGSQGYRLGQNLPPSDRNVHVINPFVRNPVLGTPMPPTASKERLVASGAAAAEAARNLMASPLLLTSPLNAAQGASEAVARGAHPTSVGSQSVLPLLAQALTRMSQQSLWAFYRSPQKP